MSGSSSSAPGAAPFGALSEGLGLTVHSLPVPAVGAEARVRAGRLKMLLVLLVCAAPVIASYFAYFVVRPGGRTNYGELILPQRELPADLPLSDLQGRAVPAQSLKGQWLLVVVAGGACDPGCEERLFLQRQLRETLGRERDRVDKVWLVDDDAPVRPEVLRAIAQGARAQVLRVPRAALARWLEPAPGRPLENHFYIVDPLGHWMMRSPSAPEPARLKRDLERLLRASASWDGPGR